MIRCVRLDSEGLIVAVGEYDDVPPGMIALRPGQNVDVGGTRKKLVDGEVVDTGVSVRPEPTYAELRAYQYPPIGDQLDAIWKALAPVLDHPATDAMMARIRAVKEAYPKPTNSQ